MPIGVPVFVVAPGQPNDLLYAEPRLELVLDISPAHVWIAIGVEKALLGRDQRAFPIDRDRATLQDHVGLDTVDAELGEDQLRARRVFVVGQEALTPRVEPKVDPCAPAGVFHDADRSRIAHPRIVDRELDKLDGRREQTFGVRDHAGVHHHGERLELDDGVRRGRVFLLGVLEVASPQFFPRGPSHQAPLMWFPLRRHPPPNGFLLRFWMIHVWFLTPMCAQSRGAAVRPGSLGSSHSHMYNYVG